MSDLSESAVRCECNAWIAWNEAKRGWYDSANRCYCGPFMDGIHEPEEGIELRQARLM